MMQFDSQSHHIPIQLTDNYLPFVAFPCIIPG